MSPLHSIGIDAFEDLLMPWCDSYEIFLRESTLKVAAREPARLAFSPWHKIFITAYLQREGRILGGALTPRWLYLRKVSDLLRSACDVFVGRAR